MGRPKKWGCQMSNPYPIPRSTRQTEWLAGDGSFTYGPFDFNIFDEQDVVVWIRAVGQETYDIAAVRVSKVENKAFDKFTVSFIEPLTNASEFKVRGKRLHERSTDLFRGGTLKSDEFEKEMSKQTVILQEDYRDYSEIMEGQARLTDLLEAIESLVGQAGPIETAVYDTRLAASVATIKPSIKVLRTGGYANPNGFGSALYVEGDGSLEGSFINVRDGRGFQLARQTLTPAMFGAPTNGVADASTAINAAIARAKAMGLKFIDGQGLRYRVPNRTAISNLYGIELQNMYLIEDVPGGDIQVNTYADKNQRWFGKEYLWPLYNWIKKTSNPIKVYAYGDSTMQAPSGWPDGDTPWQAFWQSMWPRLAKLKGLKQPLIATNRGVGGQSVSGMDFSADLAGGMQLMLIKYGINDATVSSDPEVALKTFAEALDAKLTAVRNSPNGDIYALSIVLVGASSTYDPASDRDASWFERLRGIYEAAARKHRCFYFDTYGYMQDSRWAIGAWLDAAGLHPEAVGYWWIFGHLFDLIFPDYELEYWRRNHNSNTSGAVFEPLSSHNRNEEYFNWGQNLNIATIPNGFPQHGGLLTLFQADRPGMQLLFPSSGKPNFNARSYDTTAEAFGVWTGVTQSISFQNGWQEFDIPAYGASYCVRTLDGDVRVRLCIRGGTALSAGSVIGVLPAGFRPSSIEQFTSFNISGGLGRIDVTTAGNIRIVGGVTADMLNASFSFRAN